LVESGVESLFGTDGALAKLAKKPFEKASFIGGRTQERLFNKAQNTIAGAIQSTRRWITGS